MDILDIFKKNKTKMTPEEELAAVKQKTLAQLDGTRQMAEKIYTTLRDIKWSEYTSAVNIKAAEKSSYADGKFITVSGEDFVNDAERMVNTILAKMGKEVNAELVQIQSERIDGELYYFAQHLEESLKNADLYSAEACLTGLFYGIWQGHRPIPESCSAQEFEDEINLRQQKIRDYKQILKVSKQIKKMDNTRKNLIKLYSDEVKHKYEDVHKEFIESKKSHESVYKEISGRTGRDANTLGPKHFEAWRLTTKNDNLYKTAEQICTQIQAVTHSISEYEDSILQIKNAAQLKNTKFDAELQMEIDKTIAAIPDKMTQVLHSVIKQQESLDKMFETFNAALNDPDVNRAMAKTMYQNQQLANELQKKEEMEKEDEETFIRKMEEEAEQIKKEIDKKNFEQIIKEPAKKKIIKR